MIPSTIRPNPRGFMRSYTSIGSLNLPRSVRSLMTVALGRVAWLVGCWLIVVTNVLAQNHSEPSPSTEKSPAPEPTVRVDADGDPLPDGAIARVGSVRWRHGSGVSEMAFLKEDRFLVTQVRHNRDESIDSEVAVWEVASGRQIHVWKGDGLVTLSSDGEYFAVRDFAENRILIHRVIDGQEIARHRQDSGGVYALSSAAKMLVVVNEDNTAELWDARTGERLHRLLRAKAELRNVAFSPDGRLVAMGDDEGHLHVHDTKSGEMKWHHFFGEDSWVQDFAFSPESDVMVVYAYRGGLNLFRATDGKHLREIYGVPRGGGYGLALGPACRLLASTYWSAKPTLPGEEPSYIDGGVKIWDLQKNHPMVLEGLPSETRYEIAMSSDGRLLAIADPEQISLWDLTMDKPIVPFDHRGEITTLTFSPSGDQLLVGNEKDLCLCEVQSGRPVCHFLAKSAQAVFRDEGKTIAAWWYDPRWLSSRFDSWDASTGKALGPGREWPEGVISPDGRLMGRHYGKVFRVISVNTGEEICRIPYDSGLIFSGARNHVTLSHISQEVYAWDSTTGEEILNRPIQPYAAPPIISDDGGIAAWINTDMQIKIWDLKEGKEIARYPQRLQYLHAPMVFSPDGSVLVVGGADGVIRLWELASGEVRRELIGHRGAIRRLAFHPDGNQLASGSLDTTVLIWDLVGHPEWPDEAASLWDDLQSKNAQRAGRAIRVLIAHPKRATALLNEYETQPPAFKEADVSRWIKELSSKTFATREQVQKKLFDVGPEVLPMLKTALKRESNAEAIRKLGQLIKELSIIQKMRDARIEEVRHRIRLRAS